MTRFNWGKPLANRSLTAGMRRRRADQTNFRDQVRPQFIERTLDRASRGKGLFAERFLTEKGKGSLQQAVHGGGGGGGGGRGRKQQQQRFGIRSKNLQLSLNKPEVRRALSEGRNRLNAAGGNMLLAEGKTSRPR